MTTVKQIKNACFLACIESFLIDNGIKINQESMINTLKNAGLCEDDGAINFPFENIIEVCKNFNIKIREINYHYPIDENFEDGSLLIGTTTPGFHWRRFFKRVEEAEKIIVMEPANGTLSYWDKEQFEETKPIYYKIELIENAYQI